MQFFTATLLAIMPLAISAQNFNAFGEISKLPLTYSINDLNLR